MVYPSESEELSIVEDLDPELEEGGGWFTPAREAWLGILIVATLVVWAAWQWIDGEIERNKSMSYQAAQQAVVAQNWNRAWELFTSASGYRDANQLAREALVRINERDDHYDDALVHIARKEWVEALSEIGEVRKVQPNYSDTLQLEAQAKRATYADALSGVVVMRPKAQPPGLYYRVNDSWVWLDGSDAQSHVLGTGVERQVVYDGPFRDLTSQAPGGMEAHERFWLEHFKPATNVAMQRPPNSRRVILARFPTGGVGSVTSFRELPFDTRDFDQFRWEDGGVWAFKFSNSYVDAKWPVGQSLSRYQTIAYQKNGASTPIVVTLPSPTENRVLLDIDLVHGNLVEAEWTGPEDVRPIIHLFLSDIDGSNRRPIFTHYGSLSGAQFSPDGSYVLLTLVTFATAGDLSIGKGTVELVTVDVVGNAPPHLVAQRTNVRNARLQGFSAPVSATIVSKGPYAGRILMSWQYEGDSTSTLQVLDPNDSTAQPVEVTVPTKSTGRPLLWYGIQDSAGLLFTLQFQPVNMSSSESMTATVTLVSLRPNTEPLVGKVVVNSQSFVTFAEAHTGGLFLPLAPFTEVGSRHLEIDKIPYSALRVTSDPDAWVTQVKPQSLYSPTPQLTDSDSSGGAGLLGTYNFGPRALAYTDGKDLYAASYERAMTVKLDSDVTIIYSVAELESNYVALH